MNFIAYILLGLVAGILANKLMKRPKKGFLKNVLLGVLGAVVGGFVTSLFGIEPNGLLVELLVAIGGACLVLWLADCISKN